MIDSIFLLELFINWIYNLIINSIGMYLYECLKSIYIVVFIFLLLTAVLYNFIKKYRLKSKIIFFICFILIYWFFILYPFQRGKEINDFQEFGYKLRDRIGLYKDEMGSFPKTLYDLYPKYLSKNDLKIINKNIKYKFYDHKIYNELRKDDKYFLPEKSDSYVILIYLDILTPNKIIYNSNSDKLIIADD